jgi:hypothetical protein
VAENEINADLDRTVASLQGGVEGLDAGEALPEIEAWEQRLSGSDSHELEAVVENLGHLRLVLSTDDFDQGAVGNLLATLGEQMQRVANADIPIEVADKLSQLSVLLAREGESLAGEEISDEPGGHP